LMMWVWAVWTEPTGEEEGVIPESFERLVLAYLKNITGPLLDPLQFAYRANRSVDDAVNMGLHFILQHLDKSGTYLLKFADDTTVIGLIQDGDESAYRQEIEQLAAWCSRNNLELNTLKTVEMIVDFRRNTPALPPLSIMNSTVPTVASFRFLGTTISQDLKWDTHIDATIKKAQQRLYFLRQLRKFNLPKELLIHFYSAVIESVLCMSITVWFGSATKSYMRRLQRTVRTAERIIGAPLPTLQELYTSRICPCQNHQGFDKTQPRHQDHEKRLLDPGPRVPSTSLTLCSRDPALNTSNPTLHPTALLTSGPTLHNPGVRARDPTLHATALLTSGPTFLIGGPTLHVVGASTERAVTYSH
ncbi:hypothetical protein QTP86_000862, partial [Hemibagrus guttatus]